MIEIELNPPKDPFLSFQDNCELRELYVKRMIQGLKLKYQRAMQNSEWEIYLVVEVTKEIEIILN